MEHIKIQRGKLLEEIKKNRNAHRAIFEKALEGYRIMAIEKLEQSIADAKAGRKINQHLGLIEPSDQTKDYDRAIRMLEMSENETVEIGEHDFACYVLDDWDWKQQFIHSNRAYVTLAETISK